MANAIEEGRVDPADKAQLYDVLRGIVTGAPQISGAFYSDRDHQLTIVNRRDDGGFEEMEADNSNDPNFARVLQLVAKGPGWGRITWQPELSEALLPFAAPVRKNNQLVGMVGVYVKLSRIVDFISDLSLKD